MAKSLRAHCNRPHKAHKRHDPKSPFAAAEAARLERLHARLAAKLAEPAPPPPKNALEGQMDVEAEGEHMWYSILGLIDPDELHSGSDGFLDELDKALGKREASPSAASESTSGDVEDTSTLRVLPTLIPKWLQE